MEQFESRYFSGQGKLLIGTRDANGAPAGLVFVGDISSASLTPSIETADVVENVSGSSGIGSSFVKKAEFQMSLTLRSIKPEHLAQALQGTATAQAAGSVTDEAIVGYLGKFTPLAHLKVSTVVVTNAAGTTTYVADTDYVLHAEDGLLEILSTGAIGDGDDLLVDYAFVNQDLVKSAPANIEHYIVFSGINRAESSQRVRCEIYKAKLDPGVLGLIQEEHAEIPINGRVLLDSLRPAGDQFFSWRLER